MFLIAHGALGPYDELIYLGIAVIFIIMMGVSWFQTRMTEYDDDQRPQTDPDPPSADPTDDRFSLD